MQPAALSAHIKAARIKVDHNGCFHSLLGLLFELGQTLGAPLLHSANGVNTESLTNQVPQKLADSLHRDKLAVSQIVDRCTNPVSVLHWVAHMGRKAPSSLKPALETLQGSTTILTDLKPHHSQIKDLAAFLVHSECIDQRVSSMGALSRRNRMHSVCSIAQSQVMALMTHCDHQAAYGSWAVVFSGATWFCHSMVARRNCGCFAQAAFAAL